MLKTSQSEVPTEDGACRARRISGDSNMAKATKIGSLKASEWQGRRRTALAPTNESAGIPLATKNGPRLQRCSSTSQRMSHSANRLGSQKPALPAVSEALPCRVHVLSSGAFLAHAFRAIRIERERLIGFRHTTYY